jgi:lysozyme
MVGTLFGVDVSPSQGTVDWAKVKAAGISFAVARCLRETGAIDGAYQRNVAGARAAGLVPGAYAFLVGGTASQQAKSFIDAVGDPTGMLIMLDVERPTVAANPVPTAADVKAFVAAWKAAHPAHPILIYGSSGSVLGTIGKTTDLHQLGPLWLAWYRKGHTHTASGFYASLGGNDAKQWSVKFGGWPGATIWQFTDGSVRVSGIQKPDGTFLAVDLNAFRGTTAQLLALTGLAAKPKPEPKVFHTVKAGETLSKIAAAFGFSGHKALIARFPENAAFKAHPELIHPGDRIRVR